MKIRELIRPSNELAARAASTDLYADGGSTVVPYMDFFYASRKDRPAYKQLDDNPILFGPAWKLAMRMAALPIKIYEFGDNGVRRENNAHPAYQLLRRPNPVLTRNLLVGHLVVDLLGHGKGAWLKVRERPGGPPVELWPIYASTLIVVPDPKTLISGFKIRALNGAETLLRPEDVCYFRLLPKSLGAADGIAPLASLSKVGTLGAAAIDAGTDMFDNAMFGRVWVKLKKELSNKAFNRLQRQLRNVMSDKFAVPMMEEDAELNNIQGPSDEVVLNALSAANKIVRDALGIPEDDNSTAFYKNAIQPIADAIEQELERSLMTEFDGEAFPEFGFRDELRGDPVQRAQFHQTQILSGQETMNEARRAENKEPLEGGDQLMIPLNLVPASDAAVDGVPRETDTGGGLGGDEGKGTLASTRSSVRARARGNYATMRNRVMRRYADQMARKLRGLMNTEAKTIKQTLNGGRAARAEATLPTVAELREIVGRSDEQVRDVLDQFMRETGDATAPTAADVVGAEIVDDVLDRLQDVYASRATAIAGRFGATRGDRIASLVENAVNESLSSRELATQIGDAYKDISTQYVDGLARTEVAFAHEQAAMVTWADAGVREIEVVDGGGPCTTGVCADNAAGSPYRLGETMGDVGYSFEGADAPPFHPGCTCFAVPHIEQED